MGTALKNWYNVERLKGLVVWPFPKMEYKVTVIQYPKKVNRFKGTAFLPG
jgi:hypothetical protein